MASFSQIPFLPVLDAAPTEAQAPLLEAISRITPLLVPASILGDAVSALPSSTEVWVLHDNGEASTVDDAAAWLDKGYTRVVSPSSEWCGQLPADRLVLRITPETATPLSDAAVLQAISGVLIETPSLAEDLLVSFRQALKAAPNGGERRPLDLFVKTTSPDPETALRLPASLKLLSKTVNGRAVLPTSVIDPSPDFTNLHSPQPQNGKLPLVALFTSSLKSDRNDGLVATVPVSVASTPVPLGLVYSSLESIARSVLTGQAVYFSRSRASLWVKGATSGATQSVDRIRVDCDSDAIEFSVRETGPRGEQDGFCHVPGQRSCFGDFGGLAELEHTLVGRRQSAPEGSYTARLFNEPKLLQAKIEEEAAELCAAESREDVAAEAADLLYFALVKCVSAGIGLREIGDVLDKRARKITRRKGDAKKQYAEKLGLDASQAKGVDGGRTKQPATDKPVANGKHLETTTAPLPAAPNGTTGDNDLRCQVFDLASESPETCEKLLKRPLIASDDMISRVKPIIDTVRNGGDEGLTSLVAKFDRCAPAAQGSFDLVMRAPYAPETMQLSPDVKSAIERAYENIKAFHGAQMDKEHGTLTVETMPGVVCSRFARPISRVGIYVPGGTAILPSTALMLAVPAQVAGCEQVVLATPPRPDGSISPEIVYIAALAGVDMIVRAGGAHAVAALAYGTESVPKVDKIFGPGNQYVTAAKMAVSMDSGAGVAIDMPAGPSEVLVRLHGLTPLLPRGQMLTRYVQVIADKTSNPAFVASDLLSQAEHGADSQVVLLTVDLDERAVTAIESALRAQALVLPRVDIIRKSIAHSLIIKCRDVDEAFDFSNKYAPEHLILHLENASSCVQRVKNAGSVFVGAYSPERCVYQPRC